MSWKKFRCTKTPKSRDAPSRLPAAGPLVRVRGWSGVRESPKVTGQVAPGIAPLRLPRSQKGSSHYTPPDQKRAAPCDGPTAPDERSIVYPKSRGCPLSSAGLGTRSLLSLCCRRRALVRSDHGKSRLGGVCHVDRPADDELIRLQPALSLPHFILALQEP